MIQTLKEQVHGCHIMDQYNQLSQTKYIINNIDDNNLNSSITSNMMMDDIHNNISDSITKWEKILQVSGGVLSTTKCLFYLMKWSGGEWIKSNNNLNQITIQCINEDIVINRKHINQSTRYLGIQLCPLNDNIT